jgi:hypothetical protein
MTDNPSPAKPRGPGAGTLALIVALVVLGCGAALVVAELSEDAAPPLAALVGWLTAGVLGATGWWTARKAMGAGPQALAKFMLGGMLVRFVLCGIAAGVVLGTGWLHQNGFILGLLTGIVVFLGVEIGGVHLSARRLPAGCV